MNNYAMYGYVVIAMKRLGYSDEKIKEVLDALRAETDFTTEYEAEQRYFKGL